MLTLSFWLLPLAVAQLYTGTENRGLHYVLVVWVLYCGILGALVLYLASLEYGTVWHVLDTLLTASWFWRWMVHEVAEVLIGLRVLGQLVYSALRVTPALL